LLALLGEGIGLGLQLRFLLSAQARLLLALLSLLGLLGLLAELDLGLHVSAARRSTLCADLRIGITVFVLGDSFCRGEKPFASLVSTSCRRLGGLLLLALVRLLLGL